MCQLWPTKGLPKRHGQESSAVTENYLGKQVEQGKQVLPWAGQLPRLTVAGTQALGMNPGSTAYRVK